MGDELIRTIHTHHYDLYDTHNHCLPLLCWQSLKDATASNMGTTWGTSSRNNALCSSFTLFLTNFEFQVSLPTDSTSILKYLGT